MARRVRCRSSKREPNNVNSIGHHVIKAVAIWAFPESVKDTMGKKNADTLEISCFQCCFSRSAMATKLNDRIPPASQ